MNDQLSNHLNSPAPEVELLLVIEPADWLDDQTAKSVPLRFASNPDRQPARKIPNGIEYSPLND